MSPSASAGLTPDVRGVHQPRPRSIPPVTTLTRTVVEELNRDYERTEAFYLVEQERLETMPEAVREGTLSWKDVEWLVRWYYRRFLTSTYNARARDVERAYRSNEWATIRATLESVIDIDDPAERVAQVRTLDGIDIPVASGMLYFIDPTRDIVMGEREWHALEVAGELDEAYPRRVRPSDYCTYLEVCTTVTDRLNITFIELQRSLWRLTVETSTP